AKFAGTVKGFGKYLGNDKQELIKKLASEYDEDRKYNGEEQPVVGISWYGAKAYCLWLSLVEAVGKKDWLDKPLSEIAGIYRLPKDIEWERAAKGIKEDNSYPREFPWGNKEPSPELANYKSHIGNTTPVDRYPNGSTPDGVLDMAGNVWEWCQDFYDDKKDARVVRGGSWISVPNNLRCSYLVGDDPDVRYYGIGFRVVCSLQ
ncbi:MAG: formylglycine-generating enzyme family protein, partial [bacterium]|nr:formylglycine-generating enzyme family protein [bacterium]